MKFVGFVLSRSLYLSLSVFTFCLAYTAAAHAECSFYQDLPHAGVAPAAYLSSGGGAGLRRVADADEPIVGLWQIKITAKGNADVPDGVVLDQGYTVWHSDHTEIMNSGRTPASGSFCLGVWKKTGALAYKLNHFALSWAKDGKGEWALQGPSNIKEEITIDAGRESFSGSFTLDDYDTKGKLLAHHTAVITGRRLGIDSPVAPM